MKDMTMTMTRNAWRRRAGAALLLFAGATAGAELDFKPYVASDYRWDSNVYRFSSQVADVTGTLDTEDRIERHLAGVAAGYTWQQQKLQVVAEGERFRFDQFAHLDHDAYAVAAGFDGSILATTRARVDVRDERRMASFEDRRTTQLIMERDQARRAEVTVAVTPQWQALVGARSRLLQSPLPDAPALPNPPPGAPARVASPDFAVHEAAFSAGVRYGIENREHPEDEAPLLVGLLLEHTAVSFSGVTPQPQPPPGVTPENWSGYALLALGMTAAYSLDGMSSLDGKLGLTQYDASGDAAPTTRDLTAEIGYIRRLSVVTELSARLFRRIVPFAATADASANTGIGFGAKWQPLRTIAVLADYTYGRSSTRGLSGVAPENSGRADNSQRASLGVTCALLRSVSLRMYTTYSDRRSNLGYNDFNDVTAGAELSLRWGAERPAAE
jgi:hypothetical protein